MRSLVIEKIFLKENSHADNLRTAPLRLLMIPALALFLSLFLAVSSTEAQGTIVFGPNQTTIDGSIPYSVIGKYKSTFKDFKGVITIDPKGQNVRSVLLDIKSNTITSNCAWCDHIVRSRRLLSCIQYPDIIFKSEGIVHGPLGYEVTGILSMHGVQKRLTFPFKLSMVNGSSVNDIVVDLEGDWAINRKDFNIYWNRLLDHGGILVGDQITVHWGIKTNIVKEMV